VTAALPLIRLCKECVYSTQAGLTTKLVCVHPQVNIANVAFLAGETAVARSTKIERASRRGICGPHGHLWRALPEE
jgi:citrate lyase beta subunit